MISLLVSLSLAAALASVPCRAALTPSVRELPDQVGSNLTSVAWADAGSLIFAAAESVTYYALKDGTVRPILDVAQARRWQFRPTNIASDGAKVIAFGLDGKIVVANIEGGGPRLISQRRDVRVFDVAIHGDSMYVLGVRNAPASNSTPVTAVWHMKLGDTSKGLQPLYALSNAAAIRIFADSVGMYGGALSVERSSRATVAFITPAEPVITMYESGTAGKPVTAGAPMTELLFTDAWKVMKYYAVDEGARYRDLFGKRQIIDDLVFTPHGPAAVVRSMARNEVTWELWYPGQKGIGARLPLGLRHPGPFGHLRCDAYGRRLACAIVAHPSVPGKSLLASYELPLPNRSADCLR